MIDSDLRERIEKRREMGKGQSTDRERKAEKRMEEGEKRERKDNITLLQKN